MPDQIRRRCPILVAFVAVAFAASGLAAATSASAHGPGQVAVVNGTGKTKVRCKAVAGYTRGGTDPSQVRIVGTKKISCRAARKVIARCIAKRGVGGWRAGSPGRTSTLSRGRRRIAYRIVSGPAPSCGRGLTIGRRSGEFGPFEAPAQYPSNWPAPYTIVYDWSTPVTTYSATIGPNAISNVTLVGFGYNRDGQMRSFWFQWGKTRDLGNDTEKQNPPTASNDAPTTFSTRLLHLKAKTRFYWRSAATIDEPGGGVKTVYGALGSFVTKPYPTIKDPSRPCLSAPEQGQLFQITESLAISCSPQYRFTNSSCFPFCVNTHSGKLSCDKDFPRNLNSGSWSFTIPEVGYKLDVNDLVSYWRSNNSNRFITTPFTNKNSPGGSVGPVPGWHDWDVGQYAYPFESTATDVQFWINCTEQWGDVIDASALAQGEGNDIASTVPPGAPTDFKAVKTSSGGYDASWQAPSSASPSGIAGYHLTVVGWPAGAPKEFSDNWLTPVDATGLSGTVPARRVAVVTKGLPPNYDVYLAVGAVSREGSIGTPAVIALGR